LDTFCVVTNLSISANILYWNKEQWENNSLFGGNCRSPLTPPCSFRVIANIGNDWELE
jgi:hypothetical protein